MTAWIEHVALWTDDRERLRAWYERHLSTRDAVDELAAALSAVDGPRLTGDGYYGAVVLDPDGNGVELTV